jgi:hypothetical protein
VNPELLYRADTVERVMLARAIEQAVKIRREVDHRQAQNLARLIRNELADMENKRRRR